MSTMFNPATLIASLIWGSVGGGFCLYGKKKMAVVPFAGGSLMILVSCVITSSFWMSVFCLVLIAAMIGFMRLGY